MYAVAVRHLEDVDAHESHFGCLLQRYPDLRSISIRSSNDKLRWKCEWVSHGSQIYALVTLFDLEWWEGMNVDPQIRRVLPHNWHVLFRGHRVQISSPETAKKWIKFAAEMAAPAFLILEDLDPSTWRTLGKAVATMPKPKGDLSADCRLSAEFWEVEDGGKGPTLECLRDLLPYAGDVSIAGRSLPLDHLLSNLGMFREHRHVEVSLVLFDLYDLRSSEGPLRHIGGPSPPQLKTTFSFIIYSDYPFEETYSGHPSTRKSESERSWSQMRDDREWLRNFAYMLVSAGVSPHGCRLESGGARNPLYRWHECSEWEDVERFEALLFDLMIAFEMTLFSPRCTSTGPTWRRLERPTEALEDPDIWREWEESLRGYRS